MAESQSIQNVGMSKWPMDGLSSTATRRKILWMKFRQQITKITKITKRRSRTKQVVLPPNDGQLPMNKGRAGCDIQKVEGNACKILHGDAQRALAGDENSPSAGSIDHGDLEADESTQKVKEGGSIEVNEDMLETDDRIQAASRDIQEVDKGSSTEADKNMLEAAEGIQEVDKGTQVDENMLEAEDRIQEVDKSTQVDEDMLEANEGTQVDDSPQEIEQRIQEVDGGSVEANEDVLEDGGTLLNRAVLEAIEAAFLEADEGSVEANEDSVETSEDMLVTHDGVQEADESLQEIEERIQEANENSVEANEDILEGDGAWEADESVLEADEVAHEVGEGIQEADEDSVEANADMLVANDGTQEADESPPDIEEGIPEINEGAQEAYEGSVEANEDTFEDEGTQEADDDILEADQHIQELAYHVFFDVRYPFDAPIHEYDEDEHRHFQLQMKPLSSKIARALYTRHAPPPFGDGEITCAARKPMIAGVTECPICRETITDTASSWFCSEECGQNFHFDCVTAWWKTDDVCRGYIEDRTALIETRCAYCRTTSESMYLFAEDDGHSASTIYLFLPWVRMKSDGRWEVLAYSAKVPFIYRIFL